MTDSDPKLNNDSAMHSVHDGPELGSLVVGISLGSWLNSGLLCTTFTHQMYKDRGSRRPSAIIKLET